jgi:hypothetical protein
MLTPMDLFNWANTAIPNIEFIFVSAAKIEELSKKLERRFKRAIAITGTRSFHSFITTTRPGELIASTLPDPRSKLPILTFEVVPPLYCPFTCSDFELIEVLVDDLKTEKAKQCSIDKCGEVGIRRCCKMS